MMRLAKFLVSHSELEWVYQAQDVLEKYVVFGDSDWGGSESRRSTRQEHLNNTDYIPSNSAARQHVTALSSGEAELYATGRAAAGGLQSVQLLFEAGMEPKLEVLTDSSANLGMHNRIGSGRVRHLDVKWLWTQEAVQSGKFSLKKVSTDSNVSDLTTKHHHEDRLAVLMSLGRLRFARGRGDAVLAANEGRTAAVNAVRRTRRARSTELDENGLRLWVTYRAWQTQADASVNERSVMVAWPRGGQDQHTSDAPVGRGSVDSAQEAGVPRVAV